MRVLQTHAVDEGLWLDLETDTISHEKLLACLQRRVTDWRLWLRFEPLMCGFHPGCYRLPIGIILRSKLAPSGMKLRAAGGMGQRLNQ